MSYFYLDMSLSDRKVFRQSHINSQPAVIGNFDICLQCRHIPASLRYINVNIVRFGRNGVNLDVPPSCGSTCQMSRQGRYGGGFTHDAYRSAFARLAAALFSRPAF
jgi:hypothetical protein